MMKNAVTISGFLCGCLILAGCSKREYSGADRFPLSGKVTCDGEVVDFGSVSFLPIGGGEEQRVSGGAIMNGTFSVPEEKGAHAGKYRVEIRWQKKTGKQVFDDMAGEMVDERKEGLPKKFQEDSELTVEVPSPDNVYDFDLTLK